MIIFNIVKEPYGWAVRRDAQMMMPACSRAGAIAEAERMVAVLRWNGDLAELCCEAETQLESAA
jgi:hypothetical protein